MRFPRNSGPRPDFLFLLVLAGWLPICASADEDPARRCHHAAEQTSQDADVPLDVLRAVVRFGTQGDTSNQLEPWPWTVNIQGSRVWFDTPDQARSYVFRHFMAGVRSFDIGCFQINYKQHSHAFRSIEEMFDPVLNAQHTARVLKELYAQHGDWTQAVDAYQASTHQYAQDDADLLAEIDETQPQTPASGESRPQAGASLLVAPTMQKRAAERRGSPASLFVSELGG